MSFDATKVDWPKAKSCKNGLPRQTAPGDAGHMDMVKVVPAQA